MILVCGINTSNGEQVYEGIINITNDQGGKS